MGNGNGNGGLHTLERNRFYYGKPMDVRHWTIEQRYGMQARRLLTRLGLGRGVLCGLEIAFAADGSLIIAPGVAIDDSGREIVVTAPACLRNPAQPTDCLGRPDGDPVIDGDVTIALCYHECLTEPAKAIACGCDTVERCEAGLVEERFCVRVDRGVPASAAFPCDQIYPAPPPEGFERRRTIFDLLGGACPPGGDGCVVLGTITYAKDADPTLDPFTYRRVVYSNETLFELILCLAARVDECCGKQPPTIAPPRVMRVAPGDRAVISTLPVPDRDRFVKRPEIELTFERDMDPAALAAPDPWLGVYSFVHEGDQLLARRVGLTLDGTPGPAPGGGQLVKYALDARYRKEMRSSRVLVQLRPDDGGGRLLLDVSAPPELLDGEHHGTGLEVAELDQIWTDVALGAGPTPVAGSIWDALLAGAPPAFPSGEGTEGGRLDLAFAFNPPPSDQPRLLAVWPPSASFLRPGSPDSDERDWYERFRGGPHVELTFDDTLDVNALGAVPIDDWVGLWWVRPGDPGNFSLTRLPLGFAGAAPPLLPVPAASVTVLLKTDVNFSDLQPTSRNHFVLVVRGDRAAVDADFASPPLTAADVQDLFDNGVWTATTGVTGPSSLGAAMADGQPGGTAVTFFDLAIDA